ncbi:tetratricopeptide repeat protein [candidate division KSB1 bacterium]|nr:tetratricopeptide repeat protein [candidate division KSB1 bacterium]
MLSKQAREAKYEAAMSSARDHLHYERFGQAIKALQEAARLCADRVEPLYMLGTMYGDQERWAATVEVLKKAVRIEPEHFGAWTALGIACHQTGDLERAEKAFVRATELQPDRVETWYAYGEVLMDLDEVVSAADAFQKAADLAPDDDELQMRAGSAQLEAFDAEAARHCFERILSRRPHHESAAFVYALSYLRSLPPDPNEAVRRFDELLGKFPHSYDMFLNVGRGFLEANDLDRARTTFEQARKLTAAPADAELGLARIAMRNEDEQTWTAHVRAAYRLNPTNSEAIYLMAILHRQEGRQPESDELLRELTRRDPDYAMEAAQSLLDSGLVK